MLRTYGRILNIEKFPGRLCNRLISAGFEPVLSNTEKSYIAPYYIQFTTSIKRIIVFHYNIRKSCLYKVAINNYYIYFKKNLIALLL